MYRYVTSNLQQKLAIPDETVNFGKKLTSSRHRNQTISCLQQRWPLASPCLETHVARNRGNSSQWSNWRSLMPMPVELNCILIHIKEKKESIWAPSNHVILKLFYLLSQRCLYLLLQLSQHQLHHKRFLIEPWVPLLFVQCPQQLNPIAFGFLGKPYCTRTNVL